MKHSVVCFLLAFVGVLPLRAQSSADSTKNVRLLIVMGGGSYQSSVFQILDALDGVAHTVVMSDTAAFRGGRSRSV